MEYKEVETKYYADDLSLQAFKAFCAKRGPVNYLEASGYDHFYYSPEEPEAFGRHRIGPDINQLTFKRKTQDGNNYVRVEHNVDLARTMTEQQTRHFVKEFIGYEYSRTIFKNAFIFKYETHILVYYIVSDADMRELGRFVEIEMAEEGVFTNAQDAWSNLMVIEKLCKPIGLSAQARIKRSLFELYGKAAA